MTVELSPTVEVLLEWDPPQGPLVRGVRLFRLIEDPSSETEGPAEPIADVVGSRFVVPGLIAARPYSFLAATLYEDGTLDPPEKWAKVRVTPSAHEEGPELPATVANFGVSQERGILHFQWDRNDDKVTVGYEIRRDRWLGGFLVGRTGESWWEWPWMAAGSQTFYIRAFDKSGRYAAAGASATLTVRNDPDYVLANTYSESGGGFTGTKTSCEVSGGALVPSLYGEIDAGSTEEVFALASYDGGGLRRSPSTYLTAGRDLGAVQTSRLEAAVESDMLGLAALTVYDLRNSMIGGPALDADDVPHSPANQAGEVGWSVNAESLRPLSVLIEVDTSSTNTATEGSVSWDGFRRFVPGEYRARWVRWRITLYSDGFLYPTVTSLIFYHRKKNLKDEGSAAVTATPGPTAITFNQPFISAPIVVATVLDAAGTEFIAQAASITTSGCNVRVYDAAGAEVFTGTIHWHALGT